MKPRRLQSARACRILQGTGFRAAPDRHRRQQRRASRRNTMTDFSRRTVLQGATAIVGASFLPLDRAQAQAKPLSVFAHRVHQTVSAGQAGDITKAWADANKVAVQWTTF